MQGDPRQRLAHLEFVREQPSAERRKKGYNPPLPDRGGRAVFGPRLIGAAETLEAQQEEQPAPPRGFNPHLIFRIPVASGAPRDELAERFRDAGLIVVGIEADGAIIAFREQTDLQGFKEAAAEYQRGPRPEINPATGKPFKTTKYDIFEFIEAADMRILGPSDRIAHRLAGEIGADAGLLSDDATYVVETELWHPGTVTAARETLNELRAFMANRGGNERLLDTFVGEYLLLAKVRLAGRSLRELLLAPVIASVDLPARADFDALAIQRLPAGQFPEPQAPPANGPRLCILDSGINTNHVLLRNHIGHATSYLRLSTSPADLHGHGTMVAGLSVFGNIRQAINRKLFRSPIRVFSARVLNEHNDFEEDTKLPINLFADVFKEFVAPPYNCRVFNLSVGTRDGSSELLENRQSAWAEQLDILARELKIVVVVSAGNYRPVARATGAEAERYLRTYPSYLFTDEARLADPATAALAITVGGLVQTGVIAQHRVGQGDDIARPLARPDGLSPISRIGPGINGAIKPEFVHYAGDLVFDGFGPHRRISVDPGVAITSLGRDPDTALFSADTGTSFAAPRVSRIAALIHHDLARLLDREPSPNTIRALIANSASLPKGLVDSLEDVSEAGAIFKSCGYGIPSAEDTLYSQNGRVTLFCEEELPLDYFHIYKIPVPQEFVRAGGTRRIIISLAYDPPVRRRRLDYLGVEMDFVLARGLTIQQIVERCRKQPKQAPLAPIEQKFKAKLVPSSASDDGFSRKKGTLQRGVFEMTGTVAKDWGTEYWLVVRAERKWAPSEILTQSYSLAVTLEANHPRIYELVKGRITQRVRQRARV